MKVIFLIPGLRFTGWFLTCFSHLCKYMSKNNIEWEVINEYTPIVHHTRDNIVKHIFKDELDYDYLMWIDDDVKFEVKDFKKLLKHAKNGVDIVSGLYYANHFNKETGFRTFACVMLGQKNPTKIDIDNAKRSDEYPELIEVFSNGMGWMMIRKGVFEYMRKYPNKYETPFISESLLETRYNPLTLCEDVAFQVNAKELGFKSYVDPSIIVGHEKYFIMDKENQEIPEEVINEQKKDI